MFADTNENWTLKKGQNKNENGVWLKIADSMKKC